MQGTDTARVGVTPQRLAKSALTPDVPAQPVRMPSQAETFKFLRGNPTRGNDRTRYPNGPGYTQAKVQRMARKKRNVKANRSAHRG